MQSIKTSFGEAIVKAATPEQMEDLRIAYLGKKGALTAVLRALKDMPEQERRRIGEEANQLRREIEQMLAEKRAQLDDAAHESVLRREWLDVTRPGTKQARGHLHPVTLLLREIEAIFQSMGFATAEGPEVETDFYNFEALNMPPHHPARDMWDTFWLRQTGMRNKELGIKDDRLLLRTHTSPVQVRYMEKHSPPIRIIIPGTVYRYEATDASHEIQFAQLEGLMVDENISIANFKAIIQEFFSRLFGSRVSIRLRPSYFPFTEPSFEIDISCVQCGRVGCALCKQSGWLELAGAGMVHPSVFKAAGWNPRQARGFAFGMGLARLAVMKYKIPDVRLLNSGDLRFLRQF